MVGSSRLEAAFQAVLSGGKCARSLNENFAVYSKATLPMLIQMKPHCPRGAGAGMDAWPDSVFVSKLDSVEK
jgi:hypothetical protein